MNKRERVAAAIAGRAVDHVPALFSIHFPEGMNRDAAAVKAHTDFYKQTDTDILKIMNENLMPTIGEIRTADDFRRVQRYHVSAPFMVNQLDLIKRIMDENPDAYTVATIHGVCASTRHHFERSYDNDASRQLMCEMFRSRPDIMMDAHKKSAETMAELSRACIEAGVDGIYYASLGGERRFYTDEEFEECIRPFDLQIMQAAREAGGDVFLHICKHDLNMQRYKGYGSYADVVNWGVYETDFSLEEGRKMFPGCTILGGLANRSGVLVDGTEEELTAEVQRIIREFGKEKFMLGADCTLPTEIPYSRIALAVRAAASV